jgi:hypothetical protein
MTPPLPHRAIPFSSRLAEVVSLNNERLFLFVVVLSIVPLWIGPYLPLVDLPQHAAQVTALRQLWSGDPIAGALFHVNWFTPYLLGYLLLYVLTLVMPMAVATKLVVSLAVALIPWLTGRLLKAVGGDEGWKWLAIPCSFSFAFYWGFLTFLITAPLGLLFLVQTVRFVAAPSLARSAGIALFSVLLFFCHVIVLGFASLIALAYVVGAHYRDLKTLVLRALPYTAPAPIIGLWLASTYRAETGVQSDPIMFGPLLYRLTQLLAQPAGREDFFSAVPMIVLVTGAVLLLPPLTGATFNRDPKRWLPLVLGALAFLLSPHYVLSTAYFYQRLGVFLVPLWLMAWDAPQARRGADWLVMAIVVLWVVTSSGRFVAFARETESFSDVLAAMEPGRRTAAMVVDNSSPRFTLPVYLHFPAWYQAERGGVVDFNFAEFYSQMVRYRADAGPRISEIVAWYPAEFQWDVNGGDRYDYFLIKASVDVADAVFKDRRSSVELVTQSGWWWLYRNLRARSMGSATSVGAGVDESDTRH